MRCTLNGEPVELPDGLSVAGLVELRELDPRAVAVEVNLELVPRSQHAATPLREGDAIELVRFVGGG